MAFLNKGLTITLTDERPEATEAERDAEGMDDELAAPADEVAETAPAKPRTVSYCYQDGLVDYVKHLVGSKRAEPVHPQVISFELEDTERKMSLEVALQWTSAYSESVHTYANTINTHEGGTHEEGFRAAMTKLVNEFAREPEAAQGEGREPHRRRHPRGPDRGASRSSSASRSSRARPRPSSATPRSRASSSGP